MQIIRTYGLAVLIYIVFLIYVWEFFIDDAYITARYARNLADGYGLVFNPGDPPFEAYSNFILVLWQAVVIPLGLDPLVMTRALSVAFVLLFIALLDRYARAHAAPAVATRAAGLAVVMVVCNAPFIVWTVGGLETVVYASLLAIVVILIGLQEAQARAGLTARLSDHWVELACVGLFLSRSEGFAVALMVAGWQAVIGRWGSGARIVALIALYLGWKYAYFGDILPAPYYAKAGQFEPWMGLVRASLFFLMWTTMGLAVLFAVHVGQTLLGWRRAPAHLWLHLAVVAVTVAYPVSLGYHVSMDDAFRLYVPVVPLLGLSAFHVLRHVLPLYGERVRFVVVPTVVALVGAAAVTLHEFKTYDVNWNSLHYRLSMNDTMKGLTNGTRAAADWIRLNTCEEDVILLYDAGMIPYYSGRHIIDIWSLAEPEIVQMNYEFRNGVIGETELYQRFQEHIASLRYDIILQDRRNVRETPLGKGFEYKGVRFLNITPDRRNKLYSQGAYEIWARTDRSFPCTQPGG